MARTRNIISPFAPVYDTASRVLILGSFPSVKAIENGFYYGNPHNRFYEVISNLLDVDLVNIDWEGKKRVLLDKHVAIHDVINSCQIDGSSDASITNVIVSDIEDILKNSSIKHIFLNGKTAGALFDRHFPHLIHMRTILPSTSPANARMRAADLIASWRALVQYL